MDANRKAAIASRIRQLRIDSPWSQPEIALKAKIGLRGYQKWEEKGAIDVDIAETLTAIHAAWAGPLLTPEFILGKSATLEALEAEAGGGLPAIERKLDELLVIAKRLEAAQAQQPPGTLGQIARGSQPKRQRRKQDDSNPEADAPTGSD